MPTPVVVLAFDKTASLAANKLIGHQTLPRTGKRLLVIPRFVAFYYQTLKVFTLINGVKTPVDESAIQPVGPLPKLSYLTNRDVYAGFSLSAELGGQDIEYECQLVGGSEFIDMEEVNRLFSGALATLPVSWDAVNHPDEFAPSSHPHQGKDIYGASLIVDAIRKIEDAIGIFDDAAERYIVGKWMNQGISKIAQAQDIDAGNQYDLLMNAAQSIHERLIAVNAARVETLQDIERLRMSWDHLSLTYTDVAKTRDSSLIGMAINEIIRRDVINGQITPAPKLIEGLESWVDITDDSRVLLSGNQVTVIDKGRARSFTGAGVVTQVPGMTKNGLRMLTNVELKTLRPIDVSPNFTVVALTVRDGGNLERIELLGGDTVFGINIADNAHAYIRQQDEMRVLANSCENDMARFHISMVSNSEFPGNTQAFLSAPQSTYTLPGFLSQSRPLMASKINRIGNAADPRQSGYIVEMMVYSRSLDQYELDALSAYFHMKYGWSCNLIGNARFDAGLIDFETQYDIGMSASAPGSISKATKYKDWFTSGSYYDLTGMVGQMTTAPMGENKLSVHTDVTARYFWAQQMTLGVDKGHRLSVDVTCEQLLKPSIGVRLNGVILGTISMDSANLTQTLEFSFRTRAERNKLELFSAGGAERRFGIDNIRLIRDFTV